ncbi:hypothetical protein GCM10027589_04450 [Actinocorallia lasiicapitis]
MTTTTMPDAAKVAQRASRILTAIKVDDGYSRLVKTCGLYNSDWQCTAGTITVDRWDVAIDAEPLLEEALRALALKAAVHDMTGNLTAAELPVARPVDEVLHAVLAQRTLTEEIAERAGISLIHATDTERAAPPYTVGCFTHVAYVAAWGEPPARYWIPADEQARRTAIIEQRLAEVGLFDLGQRHAITFAEVELLAG